MISFVITIADLFTMDTGFGQEINFKQNKHRLVIPVYQREYKWENERIATLLSDISQNSKFIGNTILDESDERYEIVDGQQRITTCFLIPTDICLCQGIFSPLLMQLKKCPNILFLKTRKSNMKMRHL